jgi:hypothetical protein
MAHGLLSLLAVLCNAPYRAEELWVDQTLAI